MAIKKVCLLVSLIKTIKHDNEPYEGIYKESCLGSECAFCKEEARGNEYDLYCAISGVRVNQQEKNK